MKGETEQADRALVSPGTQLCPSTVSPRLLGAGQCRRQAEHRPGCPGTQGHCPRLAGPCIQPCPDPSTGPLTRHAGNSHWTMTMEQQHVQWPMVTLTHSQRHSLQAQKGETAPRGTEQPLSLLRPEALGCPSSSFSTSRCSGRGRRVNTWPAKVAWPRLASHGCSHNLAAVTGHPRGCSPEMLLVGVAERL